MVTMRRRRSEGMRPPKRHREVINALKVQLALCHAYEWQKAQCIYDQMASILGRDNLRDGGVKMYPRACRCCRMYGHSRQRCPNLADLELQSVRAEMYMHTPLCEDECTPQEWVQVIKIRRFSAKAEQLMARSDIGCKEGSEGACGKCDACQLWDTEFSKWRLDTDDGTRPSTTGDV